MNLLLDTHTFIWFITGSEQLSRKAKSFIENPSNENYISMASLWEISVKVNIKKLELGKDFKYVIKDVYSNGFQVLSIGFPHLIEYSGLPLHHRDPFDRLIISQSRVENMSIIGRDEVFDSYITNRIW